MTPTTGFGLTQNCPVWFVLAVLGVLALSYGTCLVLSALDAVSGFRRPTRRSGGAAAALPAQPPDVVHATAEQVAEVSAA